MRLKRAALLAAALLLLIALTGSALCEEGAIRTFLTFRITTRTQHAIVNVGEDLQIDVGIEGAAPTGYQWFFEGEPILENGNERILNILNASLADAGLYTMEAYNGEDLALKVEVNVRVIDPVEIPESGDGSLPVEVAFIAMALCAAAAAVLLKVRRAKV